MVSTVTIGGCQSFTNSGSVARKTGSAERELDMPDSMFPKESPARSVRTGSAGFPRPKQLLGKARPSARYQVVRQLVILETFTHTQNGDEAPMTLGVTAPPRLRREIDSRLPDAAAAARSSCRGRAH